ncbi:MAG: response regulator [Lachnospiraceae bacterium]|nr:response regulator [Lachnospiraceae bacterium]
MNIIAVEDEKLALESVMSIIAKACPEAGIHGFRTGEAVLRYLEEEGNHSEIHVAFLDVEMRGIDGVTLAGKLIKRFPSINIIFTTGYSEYSLDALKLHASGYIMKPITLSRVQEELSKLRYPVEEGGKRIKVRTFGNFEVFFDGMPMSFRYSKTKELFAYLVDRRGALCRNSEIASVLWDDDEDDKSHVSYLKNIRTDLLSVLEANGCLDCITRTRGEIGIVTEAIDCDYYDWLSSSDKRSSRLFRGEYMSQYSWAEYTLAALLRETGDV